MLFSEIADSLKTSIATDPRDWSRDDCDAWLYGVIVGWDGALPEVAAGHGWSSETLERLRAMRSLWQYFADE
jgi:hypothetical protein